MYVCMLYMPILYCPDMCCPFFFCPHMYRPYFYWDCCRLSNVHLLIIPCVVQRMSLPFDERDVAIHLDFRSELKSVLDMPSVSVPQLFIRGHHIGGADVVTQLVDEDAFVELVEEINPIKGPPQVCKGCGNMKFVPCLQCSGSHKIQDEHGDREDCPTCNENGLIRCPWCAA